MSGGVPSVLLLVLILLVTNVVGSTLPTNTGPSLESQTSGDTCSHIQTRREWRTLSALQKLDFIRAVKCLQLRRPKHSSNSAVKNVWDELIETHIDEAHKAHTVGQFLPWHRNYLRIYENLLRESCLYFGPLPFWDQGIDADSLLPFLSSPIFHPILGFGGDGVPGTYALPIDPYATDPVRSSRLVRERYKGCVRTGPFASLTLHLGPGLLVTDHCLTRDVAELFRPQVTSEAWSNALAQPTFEKFRLKIDNFPIFPDVPSNFSELMPHETGHAIVGGDLTNFYTSPGDPLFYLHHANIDRVWWQWQQLDLARLTDISGPADVNNLNGPQVALNTVMSFGTIAPNVTVGEMMNTALEPLCYSYA
ncbi:tyrosinase [Coprinopsis marcescibilis]|uniref:Tyrosinase n=1 Tax=Coprinopsis marcescibilis TaxID=230819 RepID=A0A5C3KLG3_COPMA|nr:tyrosinase [Coprinopsis marcescibilis]